MAERPDCRQCACDIDKRVVFGEATVIVYPHHLGIRLIEALRIVLKKGPNDQIDLQFEFSARWVWQDGVRVMEDAEELQAA